MKKLLTFAAFAAFAASVQAATITWGFGGDVYLMKGGEMILATADDAPAVAAGSYLALVYVGQDVSTFDISSISDTSIAHVTTGGDPATAAYAVYGDGTYAEFDPYQLSSITVEGDYASGASFGVVWYDAGRTKFDYIYSTDGDALNNTTTITWSGDNSGRAQGEIMPAPFSGGAVAVPEPSVALLGLLGLGMLLKRRRA